MRRRWLRIAIAIAGVGVMVVALQGRVPSPTAIVSALTGADRGWLIVAAAAEAVSLDMFARQQRRLLAALGVRLGIRGMLAITYARSAMSVSLPAGSAVSAGFAYGQFRTRGASSRTAATVMVLSGLLSAVGLGLLAAAGGLAVLVRHGNVATRGAAVVAVVAAAIVAVCRWPRRHQRRSEAPSMRTRLPAGPVRLLHRWRPAGRTLDMVGAAIKDAADLRALDWLVATTFAALNWLADLLCLYAATRAVGLKLPLLAVTGGYLAVQIVRQVPVTPGGIGVIEASLLVALVSAGAPHPEAVAAVVIYRALSCWLIVAVGLVAWTVLEAGGKPRQPVERPSPDPVERSDVTDAGHDGA